MQLAEDHKMTTVPNKMKAIAIEGAGGPDVLKLIETKVPDISDNEILVRVHAAGVNRPDIMQRQGIYPPPPGASPLPGLDVSGKIVRVGKAVTRFKEGDNVTALVTGGGYAQYTAVTADTALPLPEGFDFIKAAALPETFFTVWSNVFDRGALKKSETLLVHGGTSGIGTTAIQLAKAFGAKVITTAGSSEKCNACLQLGADLAINYHEKDFVEEVKAFTDGKGADVILDMIGGDYTNKNYKAAAYDGRIVQLAFINGNVATINLNYILVKRLIHTGSTLRARDTQFKASIAAELYKKVWPLLAKGVVKPIIDQIFPLEEVQKAHERMESSQHIGKIMLEVN